MALTIRDVAEAAGVSTATVSRALRGLENVDPTTRARVVEVARAMKFSVSPAASRLASGRAGTVGIVTPFIGGWYFTEVFAGIEAGLQQHDVDMLLHATGMPGSNEHPVRANERIRRRVDGVIVMGMPPQMVASEGLVELEVPLVLLGTTAPELPSVSVDDYAGARTAVRHLVDRGHRRIALISGRPLPTMFVPENDRLSGYLDVLRESGLHTDEELRQFGHFTVSGGELAMAALLEVRPRPTAVFCMSDEMAYGAIRTLNRLGLRPGRDIALIGYDGHDLSDTFDLSTVAQPVRDLGRVAAAMLAAQIDRPDQAAATELPTQLVIRGSSGE